MDRFPLVGSAAATRAEIAAEGRDAKELTRDFRLLLSARLLRAFAFGYAAILVPLQLEARGLSPRSIGLALGVGALGAGLGSLLWARVSLALGRRRALALIGCTMALTGLDLAFARASGWLVAAGVTGMLGAAAVDLAPFAPIEQAVLTETVSAAQRNLAFSRYALTAGVASACGGLSAALAISGGRRDLFFAVYAAIGLMTAALALALSPRVETGAARSKAARLTRPVLSLAGLFALDALGGGFVVNGIIAYWLHVRFGAGTQVLGPAFGAIALAQAASYEIAGRLANRIGLITTMVVTHLPSNILLVLVPFAPNLPLALALLIARFSLSQMDVPTRQAYVVSIVPPEQRAPTAAVMTAGRGVTTALGPAIAGAAIQSAAFGLPFVLGGGIKILYDVTLFLGFRNRPGEHEEPRAREGVKT